MRYIQGQNRYQAKLLPDVLDDYILEDNPARIIDAFVDSLDLKSFGFSKTEMTATGRPAYSPYDLLKLYIYGYFNKVRSSRKLEKETQRNVEVMWLLGKLRPDHKTISRFRKENLAPLKKVFDAFVKLCLKMNLYSRQLISIDGSHFSAVNAKDRNYSTNKLKDRISHINNHISRHLAEMETNDINEVEEVRSKKIADIVASLKARKEKYTDMLEQLETTGETQISLTDPDSRLLVKLNSRKVVYNVQTAVDGNNAMVVDYEVINTNDRGQMHSLALKCKEVLEVDKLVSIADKGYIAATDIAKCISDGIVANVPLDEGSLSFCIETDQDYEMPETYENGRIVYLKNRNICVCPMGQVLYPSSYRKRTRKVRFMNGKACAGCKQKCTSARYGIGEVSIKKADFSKLYNVEGLKLKPIHYVPDVQLLKKRKSLSEHPFGVIKRGLGADYFLLKRFSGVTAEMALIFLVFNMKRAINILGTEKILTEIRA